VVPCSYGAEYTVRCFAPKGRAVTRDEEVEAYCTCPDFRNQRGRKLCKHALRCLLSLVDPSVEPVLKKARPQAQCTVCTMTFDPEFPSVCETPHDCDDVEQTNKTSKGSTYECSRCGTEWSDGSFGYHDPWVSEESGACFRGRHVVAGEEGEDDTP